MSKDLAPAGSQQPDWAWLGVQRELYWWVSPAWLVLVICLPIFLLSASLNNEAFVFYGQSGKFLSGQSVWLGFWGLMAFVVGAALAEHLGATPTTQQKLSMPQTPKPVVPWYVPAADLRFLLAVLFAITILCYAIFLLPAAMNPGLVIELFMGSTSAMFVLRETLNQVAGVTSFVALQSLCGVLVLLYPRLTGEETTPRWIWGLMGLVIGLCVLRSFLWSERIAVLELALPMLMVWVSFVDKKPRKWLNFAPILGVVGVFGLFALGEYFRSWQFYQSNTNFGGFWEFAVLRFAGYYATALNNGAAMAHFQEPFYFPTITAMWFYKLPIWNWIGIDIEPPVGWIWDMLKLYGNEEMTNTSGLFMPIVDYGTFLGILCWLILGMISGVLFRLFKHGELLGLLLYPTWFYGVAEILRIFYWGNSRYFPILLVTFVVVFYLKQRMRIVRN